MIRSLIMKMVIKILILIMLISPSAVFASNINLYINETPVNSDVPAQIINGRMLLPLRALLNSLGVTDENIYYDSKEKIVLCTIRGDFRYVGEAGISKTIIIKVGDSNIRIVSEDLNERIVQIDSPAVIIDNRTFLPVRGIANALSINDSSIFWDSDTRTAYIVPEISQELVKPIGYYVEASSEAMVSLNYMKWAAELRGELQNVVDNTDRAFEINDEARAIRILADSVKPSLALYKKVASYVPPMKHETFHNLIVDEFRLRYLSNATIYYGLKTKNYDVARKGVQYMRDATEVLKSNSIN